VRRRSYLKDLDRHAQKKLFRFGRRVRLLRLGHDDGTRLLDAHQREIEMSALIVNLLSFWSNWCRAFYLSSALGAVSASGAPVSSGLRITSEHDALTVAITGGLTPSKPPPSVWPSRREPTWYAPDRLLQAIVDVRLTSATALGVYLRSAPQSLNHLRIMRNYYAHRSEQLVREAIALGPSYLVGGVTKPSEILLFVEPGRTISVLERWILDLGRLTTALCA
jgi:hypothetical protein